MRKDALGTSGARRARWHAGDERRGGKALATEEGKLASTTTSIGHPRAHQGGLGGNLEHVVDGGEGVTGIEEEDGSAELLGAGVSGPS